MRAKAVFGMPPLGFGGSSALLKVGKTSKDEKFRGDNGENEGVMREFTPIESAVSRSWKKLSIESVPRNEAPSCISLDSVGKEVVVLSSADSKLKGSAVDASKV